MSDVTQADIARWRKFEGGGMISAVGEYTPQAFWDVLDALETEREATRPLVEALGRVTEHLAVWAGDYPEDRTSETEAAIYCARQALAQHTKAQGPNT